MRWVWAKPYRPVCWPGRHGLQAASAGEREARQAEHVRVRRQMERLVEAIADGTPAVMVRDRLVELEARRLALEAELSSAVAPAPRLHPKLAEVYRQRVAALGEALAADGAAEARELVRGLVETITLVPEAGGLRIEVRGEVGAILRLAEGARKGERPSGVAEAFCAQVKMVAGACNHLYRTRFRALSRR